jgi:MraZ protein
MAFLGTETLVIDKAGRVSIPAHMRRAFGREKPYDTFFLIKGFTGCLELYAPEGWARIEQQLLEKPIGDTDARDFMRAYLNDAKVVTVDTQGRVTIPSALIAYAGLGKEATLHGQIDCIEVWNPDRHREALSRVGDQLAARARQHLGGK